MDWHDPFSSASHLGTAVWAAFATLILVRLTRRHGGGQWAVGLYGASMVLLYTASGLFHGLRYDSAAMRAEVQKLDKSAIFLLIAGSNVPVMYYLLGGWWRRCCLAATGVLVAAGVGTLWLGPSVPHDLLVGLYVAMGVVGLVPFRHYLAAVGWAGMAWVGAMAGCYLSGAAVEVLKWPVLVPGWFGPHDIMHVADVAGSLVHFSFVTRYVITRRPIPDPGEPG